MLPKIYSFDLSPLLSTVPLNSLCPGDSASTDSDEDLAEELDEFFRFMIWIDLSGELSGEDSSFIEHEEREGSISATDLFAEIDDFDDIIVDCTIRMYGVEIST